MKKNQGSIVWTVKKAFKTELYLRNHMLRHTAGSFNCPECNEGCTSVGILRRHMEIHKEDQTFICPKCREVFTTVASLILHNDNHNKMSETEYPCPECQEIFGSEQLLQEHLKDHELFEQISFDVV